MDILREVPARLRFVSCEPLLDQIDLDLTGFDWVITGGESGPNYRKADPDWFRHIREQCFNADVPYFHKQNGGNRKISGCWGGRELDGDTYDRIPLASTVNNADRRAFIFSGKLYKAVKLCAPISQKMLGYQVSEIDSQGRLLRMHPKHNTVIVCKDGTWKRGEGYFPTPDKAIAAFLSPVNDVITYE
jgi:hypothetical protein